MMAGVRNNPVIVSEGKRQRETQGGNTQDDTCKEFFKIKQSYQFSHAKCIISQWQENL